MEFNYESVPKITKQDIKLTVSYDFNYIKYYIEIISQCQWGSLNKDIKSN